MATLMKEETKAEQLEKLGMKEAANQLRKKAESTRKMMIAYEHYRFVKPEKIQAFNEELRKKTQKKDYSYQTLSFTSLDKYEQIPPEHVLIHLAEAQERKCFDSFEIAHIMEVKDPILFGRVANCKDRFFIDQWDDDVKIEDILKENEG